MILHDLQYFIYIFITLFYLSPSIANEEELKFPDGFLIGAATSAYQIEGAWNVSDKGKNAWDDFTHTHPEMFFDGSNGDIAADSYHKYKDDVAALKQLGMDFYRFSLSWSRILPNGYANKISEDGIKYYNDLLDELEKNNIKSLVTLYHWDYPLIFQETGGWANEMMVDIFADYARVVFREFGHRVKMFITFNEPLEVCKGYLNLSFPPGFNKNRHGEYSCTTNILKAHARAYHIYNEEFRRHQNGNVGITLNSFFYYPKNKNDNVSNEVAFQFDLGRYANPIFSKNGDYPELFKQRIADNSKFEGLPRSRLPSLSQDWIEYIRGSFDFLGLNHYSSKFVEPAQTPKHTVYEDDHGLIYSYDKNWSTGANDWLKVVPDGFLNLLLKIKEEYGNPPVYITENGYSDYGAIDDAPRSEYLYSYLKAMLTAVNKYDCNVKMYAVWSLIDNFEWMAGYRYKFGLYHVDFTHPNRTRTPKNSVFWLKEVIRSRKLLPPSNNTIHLEKK